MRVFRCKDHPEANGRKPQSGDHAYFGRYVDEFTFRLNEGNVGRHTTARLDSFVDAVVGKRITYKQVIA